MSIKCIFGHKWNNGNGHVDLKRNDYYGRECLRCHKHQLYLYNYGKNKWINI